MELDDVYWFVYPLRYVVLRLPTASQPSNSHEKYGSKRDLQVNRLVTHHEVFEMMGTILRGNECSDKSTNQKLFLKLSGLLSPIPGAVGSEAY